MFLLRAGIQQTNNRIVFIYGQKLVILSEMQYICKENRKRVIAHD